MGMCSICLHVCINEEEREKEKSDGGRLCGCTWVASAFVQFNKFAQSSELSHSNACSQQNKCAVVEQLTLLLHLSGNMSNRVPLSTVLTAVLVLVRYELSLGSFFVLTFPFGLDCDLAPVLLSLHVHE